MRNETGTITSPYKSRFEMAVAGQLESHGISDFKYESEKLKYTIPHTYRPDFTCGRTHIEVKGYLRPSDRTKLKAVRLSNPDADIRLLFKYDNKLNSKAKMKYSEWAEKNGFKYAFENIPDEWIKEIKCQEQSS